MSKRAVLNIFFLSFCLLLWSQENLELKKVKFKGNGSLNNLLLKEHITFKTSNLITRKILKKEPVVFTQELYNEDIETIRDLYYKSGYLKTQFLAPVIKTTKNNKLIITFRIVENDPTHVSEIKYQVNDSIPFSKYISSQSIRHLKLHTELRSKHVFNDEQFRFDQNLINEQFKNAGYAYSQTEYKVQVDTITNQASILWNVVSDKLCYFDSTTISGHNKVAEKDIRKQLSYKTGDVWSQQKLNTSQRRIYNLGLFRVSSLRTTESAKPYHLPVNVKIKEAPRWSTQFGVGYGSEDKIRAFGELQKLGLITKTDRINFHVKHSSLEPYHVYLKYAQPAFISPINTMVLHPYTMQKYEPGYKVDQKGFNLSFLQNFSDELNTSFSFYFEDVKQDTTNVDDIIEELIPETIYMKSGFSVGLIYSNALPALDPTSGYSIAYNLKTNGMLFTHTYPFIRNLFEVKKYHGLQYGLTLALKGKIGFASTTNDNQFLPPEERFYAGGSHSVRGWSRSDLGPKDTAGKPLGGKSLLEGSVELRYQFIPKTTLAAFVDLGNVWLKSFEHNPLNLKYAGGLGIRYATPIGSIGIDAARPIFDNNNQWQFHFNIGHPF
ncbi:BamA/OMP85 family outer membrane protein [Labilibacter marinus]|uniref:BamA/OMP85 family outer membrane protein n=1 Tax=Labilibacter marinus TaxID=1477105 RepID=UPI00117B6675|nr:BamA/TamA family outer membrane protein [Labilibacter marinus]